MPILPWRRPTTDDEKQPRTPRRPDRLAIKRNRKWVVWGLAVCLLCVVAIVAMLKF